MSFLGKVNKLSQPVRGSKFYQQKNYPSLGFLSFPFFSNWRGNLTHWCSLWWHLKHSEQAKGGGEIDLSPQKNVFGRVNALRKLIMGETPKKITPFNRKVIFQTGIFWVSILAFTGLTSRKLAMKHQITNKSMVCTRVGTKPKPLREIHQCKQRHWFLLLHPS